MMRSLYRYRFRNTGITFKCRYHIEQSTKRKYNRDPRRTGQNLRTLLYETTKKTK